MYLPVKPVGLKMISASSDLAAKAEPIRYSAAFQPTKQNQSDTLSHSSQQSEPIRYSATCQPTKQKTLIHTVKIRELDRKLLCVGSTFLRKLKTGQILSLVFTWLCWIPCFG